MKLFSKIAIVSWAFYFLLSVTGISLQRLYCHCAGAEWISIFEIEKKCDDHQPKKVEKKSCCSKSSTCDKPSIVEQQSEDGCCDPKSEYIKADIDLISAHAGVDFLAIQTEMPVYHFTNLFIEKATSLNTPNYRPPPLRHGSELRDFIQSYLC